MATGKIRYFCDTPSASNASPATMILEINGTNVPITDDCGGFKQFLTACAQNPALDAEASGGACSGGPAPNGTDNCIVFLGSPVDLPPMEKGRITIGSITLQVAHTQGYGLRFDSMMSADVQFLGGQLVLHPEAPNQIGCWVQPRSELPVDPAGPVVGSGRFVMPSIVGVRGLNQILCYLDHSLAPIVQQRFEFTEPNAGDFGIVVPGAGHGFFGNRMSIVNAHGQKYGCVDIGHGAALNGGGNTIDAIVAPEPLTGTGFDYWGKSDILDLQVISGDSGNGWRGIMLEQGSTGLQCRVGQNVAATPIVVAPNSGHPKPNVINGVSYTQ